MRIEHHSHKHNHRLSHSFKALIASALRLRTNLVMANLPPATQPSDANAEPGPDQTLDGALDGTLDVDIDMNLDTQPQPNTQETAAESLPEPPPAPTKKDISLRDFMAKMDDYAPIVRSPPSFPNPHLKLANPSRNIHPAPALMPKVQANESPHRSPTP